MAGGNAAALFGRKQQLPERQSGAAEHVLGYRRSHTRGWVQLYSTPPPLKRAVLHVLHHCCTVTAREQRLAFGLRLGPTSWVTESLRSQRAPHTGDSQLGKAIELN